jgi:putative ABC transport system permease protein
VWRVSVRDLQWRRRRFTIAVGATALVFAMTLLLSGASSSLTNENHRIVRVFGADAWVVAEGSSGPFTTASVTPAARADEVAAAPGVDRAEPVVLFRSTIREKSVRDVNVVGFRSGGVMVPRVVRGRALRGPGETLADTRLGLGVGEEVVANGHRLRVVGVVTGVTFNFGVPTLLMPVEDAQALAFGGQPLATAFITEGVPGTVPAGLQMITNQQAIADLARVAKSGHQSIDFINVLLWIVAAGIIGSMVYLSALERVRDFAVLKATGASSRSLLAGLALQAVVLSAAGALAAAVLAQPLAASFPFPVEIPSGAYLRLLVIAIVVGMMASVAGLRRAVGVDPALAFTGA